MTCRFVRGLPSSWSSLLPLLVLLAAGCGRSAVRGAASADGGTRDAARTDAVAIDARDTALPMDARPADGPVDATAPRDVRPPDGRPTVDMGRDVGIDTPGDGGPPIAVLTSIDVRPAFSTAAVGTVVFLSATGVFSDGSTRDLTAMATWTSNSPAVSVDGGQARANAPGTATVTARAMGLTGSAVLVVSVARLTGLTIDPASTAIGVRGRVAFRATGSFSDGSKQDLTAQVSWSSSNPMVAMVSLGEAVGTAAGTTTIGAVYVGPAGDGKATAQLTVTAAPLTGLEIGPQTPTVTHPTVIPFTATGLYADGTTADLTASAAWNSSEPMVLQVGSGGLGATLGPGVSVVSARVGEVAAQTAVRVLAAPLLAIMISPESASVPRGTTQAFTAIGLFADMTRADVTASVTWSTSNPMVASVSNTPGDKGLATALSEGGTEVIASLGGVMGLAKLSVPAVKVTSLSVSPSLLQLAIGRRGQLTATATFSDGSQRNVTEQVVWQVSDGAVAAVSNAMGEAGEVSALAEGKSEVTARFGDQTGSATVAVSRAALEGIVVGPEGAIIAAGGKQRFTAKGLYSDGTTLDITEQVTWSTDAPMVATISNADGTRGEATGLNPGGTAVIATLDGVQGLAKLTVNPPGVSGLLVEPITPSRRVGQTVQFGALALLSNNTIQNVTSQATWTVSDPNVTISASGLARCVSSGMSRVTATYMGFSDSTVLTCTDAAIVGVQVTPFVLNLQVGQRAVLQATAIFSDGTFQPVGAGTSWMSSDPMVAPVMGAGPRGQVLAASEGMATVTVSYMGFSGSASVTVARRTLTDFAVSPGSLMLRVGQTSQLQATAVWSDGTIQAVNGMTVFTSSEPAIADVSNTGNRGQVTGVGEGMATITASFMGRTDTVTVSVRAVKLTGLGVAPVNPKLRVGQMQQFQATALYEDGSSQNVTANVLWSSSDPAVAPISNAPGPGGGKGAATAVRVGTTTISASYMGLNDSTVLTVTEPKLTGLSVSPAATTIGSGQTVPYQAVALYDDGSTQTVTGSTFWTSSDEGVATVSNGGPGPGGGRGVATGLGAGTTTITGAYAGLTGTAALTVSAATLTAIQVTPVNATLPKGVSQPYQAVGVYSDLTTRNITGQVTWVSSNPAVADVTNGGGRGLLTAIAEGMTEISATLSGITGKTNLTVTAATVKEVQVTPTNPLLLVGGSQAFTATAVYSDFSLRTVTGMATWSSSNEMVAQVSNAGTRGVATAVGAGTSTISATFMGVTGSSVLTVTSAMIKEIQVTPPAASTPVGLRTQFTATAVLADMSTVDITASATWQSSAPAIVAVSNVGGARGLATALGPGTATITASYGGFSGQATYTVGAMKLATISLAPADGMLPKGGSLQFSATGEYDDGSKYDLTGVVTWISTDPAVAAVSNAAGSRGLVTGVGGGMTMIQAFFDGKTGATGLTVN